MTLRHYITQFCLTGDDADAFDDLTRNQQLLDSTIRKCVPAWQGRQYPFKHTILLTARVALRQGFSPRVAGAFALYLCCRIQRLVQESGGRA